MTSRSSSSDAKHLRTFSVRVHEGVYEDLDAIRAYIARSHPQNATNYVEKIVIAIDRLQTLPHAWPIVRTLRRSNVRQMSVGSHRLIFRVNDKTRVVDVFGVAHGQQQLAKHWLALRAATNADR